MLPPCTEEGYAQTQPIRHRLVPGRTPDPREPRAPVYVAGLSSLRALIVLAAAEGRSNDEIAAALSVGRDVVSLWRKRFFYERLAGLDERPRSGRPRAFPPRRRRPSQSPGV